MRKQASRSRDAGIAAAARGLYPADDGERREATADEKQGVESIVPIISMQPSAELPEDQVPPYSRELEGSPGPGRRELP